VVCPEQVCPFRRGIDRFPWNLNVARDRTCDGDVFLSTMWGTTELRFLITALTFRFHILSIA
jgi:hypothetical protein